MSPSPATPVALIAGGSSGLGLSAARHLLKRGLTIVVLGRGEDAGRRAAAGLGTGASFIAGDVASPADVSTALDRVEAAGTLRVVVNCAGIHRPGKTLGRSGPLPLPEFTELVTVNLVGAFNLVRLAAARMATNSPVDGERGVLVLTASAAAFEGQRGQVGYAAAKAGVVGMTLPLARDLAGYGIRVVTIAPALFDTPMLHALPDNVRQSLRGELAYPRTFGDPEHFALLVEHIVDNPMLNGATLRLDGAVRLPSGLPRANQPPTPAS
ncbi:SDR family NAD(P)-dependent oxidoreductase [Dactylosporangium sp. NPDC049525]|uniref:SDR family NAD(P)-dependent oxidoreductase n=1 Tax=Dactylosporangium sp. NPDC049525 TaxID=3154730 RepID=UPI00343587A2